MLKLLLLKLKPSTAQNCKFNKSVTLEPIRILRYGKRHTFQNGEIFKEKFQTRGPNTRLVNDGEKLGLRRFEPTVIYSATFATWYLSMGQLPFPRSHDIRNSWIPIGLEVFQRLLGLRMSMYLVEHVHLPSPTMSNFPLTFTRLKWKKVY